MKEELKKKKEKGKTLFPIARFGRSKEKPTKIFLFFFMLFFFSIDANPLAEARLFRSTNAQVMVYSDLFITYGRSR